MPRITTTMPGAATARRAVRTPTGTVAVSGAVSVVCTFPQPFASTAYTVVVTVESAASSDDLRVRKIVTRDAASVTVLVGNNDALIARSGFVHVVAIAD